MRQTNDQAYKAYRHQQRLVEALEVVVDNLEQISLGYLIDLKCENSYGFAGEDVGVLHKTLAELRWLLKEADSAASEAYDVYMDMPDEEIAARVAGHDRKDN